ncbi:hypothetical protein FQA39_LY17059 [Lamprigera yunnana]|nr:hypothetical protein FQA39_LY17059 [Lamprigera yunnana]
MDDRYINRFIKMEVEKVGEETERGLAKIFMEEKKSKSMSSAPSFKHRYLKTPICSITDAKRRNEYHIPKAGSSFNATVSSDYKWNNQMDIRRTTMLTNLASSYYEKFNSKSSPLDLKVRNTPKLPKKWRKEESENMLDMAIHKIKVRASILENERKKKNTLIAIKNKINDNSSRPKLLSNSSKFDLINNDVQIDKEQSLAKDKLHFRGSSSNSYVDANEETKAFLNKKLKITSRLHLKSDERQSIDRSTSCMIVNEIKQSVMDRSKSLQCSYVDDIEVIHKGTSPSDTLVVKNVTKTKSSTKTLKSSIPVKCKACSFSSEYKDYSKYIRNALQKIEFVKEEVHKLQEEINLFLGVSIDNEDYIYMNEVMMRNLIKLDNLDTHCNEIVRAKRKEAIQYIQINMHHLQDKLIFNQDRLGVDDSKLDYNFAINPNKKTDDK